jgi:hypothetical protein
MTPENRDADVLLIRGRRLDWRALLQLLVGLRAS